MFNLQIFEILSFYQDIMESTETKFFFIFAKLVSFVNFIAYFLTNLSKGTIK